MGEAIVVDREHLWFEVMMKTIKHIVVGFTDIALERLMKSQ